MIFRALSTNERAEAPGYTHICEITADDLTQVTVAAAQTITVSTFNAGDQMIRVFWYLKRPFENTADAAFNATTVSVGDTAAVTTHLVAAEANLNGTEIIYRTGNTTVLYTAADILTVTFNSMAAKALVNLNRGDLVLLFGRSRLRELGDSLASPRYTKP
jgi:hypothetical protein